LVAVVESGDPGVVGVARVEELAEGQERAVELVADWVPVAEELVVLAVE
jgi:hypothetical protein